MANCRKTSFLVLMILMLITSYSIAAGSWWETGLKVLTTATESNTAKKTAAEPATADIGKAFKEALSIGSENVVKQLGKADGFNADPAIHIPLPGELETVKNMLNKIGMSSMVDDLELKLNRAAEAATPKAKELFLQSINEMTFDDVQTIYNGPQDSATKYFKSKMSPALKKEMTPIVEKSLSEVGAVQAYDNVIGQYKTLPFVPDVKSNLTNYVLEKGTDGIFYYLAKEEAAIRKDPVKQTTALLKQVFGAK
ncbi:DUF4197 domain-containing protein [Desulfobacterium sp. N47]|uniref:DUF4197 domain-containing protein n=1 Tax=uncultured Desulfobacterium sp. TaxID=201089 RepID=E1Y8J0_9BACT|nr:hypothetical protein N47_A09130 [uncultured Desulfobacterium sp.]